MLGLGFGRDVLSISRRGGTVSGSTDVPIPTRTLAVYGDSFAQRAQDITGSPNLLTTGMVSPVAGRWATPETNNVGGVSWGVAAWLSVLTGRYRTPYQLNFGVGGLNTGQLAQDGTGGNFLGNTTTYLSDAISSGIRPHGVLLHAGTNDTVTTFSALQSYNNIRSICEAFTALGLEVFVSTVLPRGNASFTGERVSAARLPVMTDLNTRLTNDLEGEASVSGRVHVIDPRADFLDTGGQENDVLPGLTYDGLHLSPEGCRRMALAFAASLDAAFPLTSVDGLGTASDPGNFLSNPLMSGTGGTVTFMGNTTSNADFTMTGTAPDGWTVRTTNTGITAWNGTDPRNVKGTVSVAPVSAAEGDAIEITVDCDGSGNTNANTRGIETTITVDLPDTSELPVGAYFEGVCRAELLSHVNCRGASAELRLAEPDGTTRYSRALRAAPNGTATTELDSSVDYTGANGLVLRTPPRVRKTGSYGTITFAVMLYFAGQQSTMQATFRISQAAVRAVNITQA